MKRALSTTADAPMCESCGDFVISHFDPKTGHAVPCRSSLWIPGGFVECGCKLYVRRRQKRDAGK